MKTNEIESQTSSRDIYKALYRALDDICKDRDRKVYQEACWENKDKILTLWHQITQQDLNDIPEEFFNWVKVNCNTDTGNNPLSGFERSGFKSILPDYIRKPMKLFLDIYQYSKLNTTQFTLLEKQLTGVIILTKIYKTDRGLINFFRQSNTDDYEAVLSSFTTERTLLGIWQQILEQDFNQLSPQFIELLKDVDPGDISRYDIDVEEHFCLFKYISEYLYSNDNKEQNLKKIEGKLQEYIEIDKDPAGTGLLPNVIADGVIVRNVYLNGDSKLVSLFERLLPKPPSSLFPEDRVPESIKRHEEQEAEIIHKVLEENDGDISKVEVAAIRLQRAFRGLKRKKEEVELVKDHIQTIASRSKKSPQANNSKCFTNQTYKPKCSQHGLAGRLLQAAEKIKPFTTVQHLTAIKAVPTILDEGLLGRKSLLRQYKSFRPASLYTDDCYNGDANVICFAPFAIDPKCMTYYTTEFVLDLDKLRSLPSEKHNPCIFFKQKDLGFDLDKIRKLKIGDTEIFFTHTKQLRCSKQLHTNIQFISQDENGHRLQYYAELPNLEMISSNFKNMNQILAMNFFKFLDKTRSSNRKHDSKAFINKIYDAFNKLNDTQLANTLHQLTLNMSDTMEFNFYGSFLMRPELITEVSIFHNPNKRDYTLNIAEFITSLKAGNSTKLTEVQEKIPQLLQSYRFIDFLLLHTEDLTIRDTLIECRKAITLPLWRQRIEASLDSSSQKIQGTTSCAASFFGGETKASEPAVQLAAAPISSSNN